MRRIFRWLGYVAIATCGLATLAVAGLWVHSYGAGDAVEHWSAAVLSRPAEHHVILQSLASLDGVLTFERSPEVIRGVPADRLVRDRWAYYPGAVYDDDPCARRRWFLQVKRETSPYSLLTILIRCPHWAILVPLLLVDGWLVRRGVVRWRRQRRAGCCEKCGYNLTGNVSGVCPECGTPTPAAAPRPPAPAEPRP